MRPAIAGLVGSAALMLAAQVEAGPSSDWPELAPGLVQTEITTGGQTVYLHQCVGPNALAHMLQGSAGIEQPCGPRVRTRLGGTFREQAMCPGEGGKYFAMRMDITPRGATEVVARTTGWRGGRQLLDVQQRLVWLGPCDVPELWTTWGPARGLAASIGSRDARHGP